MTGMDGSLPYFYRRDGMGWIGVVDGLLVLVWIREPREKKVIIIMVLYCWRAKRAREKLMCRPGVLWYRGRDTEHHKRVSI